MTREEFGAAKNQIIAMGEQVELLRQYREIKTKKQTLDFLERFLDRMSEAISESMQVKS